MRACKFKLRLTLVTLLDIADWQSSLPSKLARSLPYRYARHLGHGWRGRTQRRQMTLLSSRHLTVNTAGGPSRL